MRSGSHSCLAGLIVACSLVILNPSLTAQRASDPGRPRVHIFREDGETAPVLTHWVLAQYSEEARKAKYQGVCLVQLTVDEHGMPTDVLVIRPLGMGLDAKAIEAVKQYRFKPGRYIYGNKPVRARVTVEVPFLAH